MKLKHSSWVMPLVLLLSACTATEEQAPDTEYRSDASRTTLGLGEGRRVHDGYIPGTATVKFSEDLTLAIEKGETPEELKAVKTELGVISMERAFPYAGEFEERTRREGLHRFYHIKFAAPVSVARSCELFESIDGVDLAQGRRRARSLEMIDPYYSRQWSVNSTYDINVDEAWAFSYGDPSVVVCVVDGGIQLNHPDLEFNVGRKHRNFVSNSSRINPEDHGTHVAGIIAATGNNDYGIAGIAGGDYSTGRRGVTLQSAQVFDGDYAADDFGAAIKWGADNGAVISQNSWGYDFDYDQDGRLSPSEKRDALEAETDEEDKAAIDYFIKYAGTDNDGNQLPGSPMKGGVVVFAAGNEGLSNGVPAAYPPAIAVGATGRNGKMADYSNYGPWVDICAPGSDIFSTITGSTYTSYSGTSMACPHVSGACALLLSLLGGEGFTNDMLVDVLLSGARSGIIDYIGRTAGPYLDIRNSLYYGIDKYNRQEGNRAPVIATSYDGGFVFHQYETISIPFTVSDPDGDLLSVSIDFDGPATLTRDGNDGSVWHFNLDCPKVKDFTPKSGRISVRDLYGGTAEYAFVYRVLKNNPPVAEKTLEDRIVVGIGQTHTVDLDGLFSDPDGEPPVLGVRALPTACMSVSIENGKLSFTPRVYGVSTVTVTATDALGETTSVSFRCLAREKEVDMDFYPNPFRDQLYIRGGLVPATAVISIYNSAGAEVYKNELVCSAFDPVMVNAASFAPGKYTLKVVLPTGEYTNTVVKR